MADTNRQDNRRPLWAAIDWEEDQLTVSMGNRTVFRTRNALALALAHRPERWWQMAGDRAESAWAFVLDRTPPWLHDLVILSPGIFLFFLTTTFIVAPFLFIVITVAVSLVTAWLTCFCVLKYLAFVSYMVNVVPGMILFVINPAYRPPNWQRRLGMPWVVRLPLDVVVLLGVPDGNMSDGLFTMPFIFEGLSSGLNSGRNSGLNSGEESEEEWEEAAEDEQAGQN